MKGMEGMKVLAKGLKKGSSIDRSYQEIFLNGKRAPRRRNFD